MPPELSASSACTQGVLGGCVSCACSPPWRRSPEGRGRRSDLLTWPDSCSAMRTDGDTPRLCPRPPPAHGAGLCGAGSMSVGRSPRRPLLPPRVDNRGRGRFSSDDGPRRPAASRRRDTPAERHRPAAAGRSTSGTWPCANAPARGGTRSAADAAQRHSGADMLQTRRVLGTDGREVVLDANDEAACVLPPHGGCCSR